MTQMAYDFGDTIHVLELDEFGASGDPVAVVEISADRSQALADAGYTVVSAWTMHGEAEGAEVART